MDDYFGQGFAAPMATLGEPSANRLTLSPVGEWHLPHGGAPVLHKPGDEMFSETVGLIEGLEVRSAHLYAIGRALPSIAGIINDLSFRLSLEMVDMDADTHNGGMFVRSGYIRAALLVRPAVYGWPL